MMPKGSHYWGVFLPTSDVCFVSWLLTEREEENKTQNNEAPQPSVSIQRWRGCGPAKTIANEQNSAHFQLSSNTSSLQNGNNGSFSNTGPSEPGLGSMNDVPTSLHGRRVTPSQWTTVGLTIHHHVAVWTEADQLSTTRESFGFCKYLNCQRVSLRGGNWQTIETI